MWTLLHLNQTDRLAIFFGRINGPNGPYSRKFVHAAAGLDISGYDFIDTRDILCESLPAKLCGQEQNVHTTGSGGSFPVLPLSGR